MRMMLMRAFKVPVCFATPISISRAAFTSLATHTIQINARPLTRVRTRYTTASASMENTPGSDSAKFKLAVCQMPVSADKPLNLKTAAEYLRRAHSAGASLAVLPECFNCPYDTACFADYAEPLPDAPNTAPNTAHSPSLAMLRKTAMDTGMYIVGGSIPERDSNGNLFNTCVSMSPDGALLAKHRKAHLFDIDIPGRITFTESSVLSAGNAATVFKADTLDVTIGVCICYDVRFAEMAAVQTRDLGAQLLIIPGAFNMTTGPAHWELLMRARAVDNQVFVAACSPARATTGDGYKAWGHSMVVDPWGTVLAATDENADVVVTEVDMGRRADVRRSVPTSRQRRDDIYQLRHVG